MDTNNYYQDPRVNQFDIEPRRNGSWIVKTFPKEGESDIAFNFRHNQNILKAIRLKNHIPLELGPYKSKMHEVILECYHEMRGLNFNRDLYLDAINYFRSIKNETPDKIKGF